MCGESKRRLRCGGGGGTCRKSALLVSVQVSKAFRKDKGTETMRGAYLR